MNLPSLFRRNNNDPLRSLFRLRDNIDDIFQEFQDSERDFPEMDFSPSCELKEDNTNYYVKFDMPGVKKGDVKVELEGNQLTVQAERKEEKSGDNSKNRFSEISYGSYMRRFTLPTLVDDKKVDAKFDNGVLSLVIAKKSPSNIKQIDIH